MQMCMALIRPATGDAWPSSTFRLFPVCSNFLWHNGCPQRDALTPKLQQGHRRTCQPLQILAARADWPTALRAPEMAQNLALAAAVQRQNVQESSGTPTGGVGASMRG